MASTKPRDLCERTFLFSSDIVAFCLVLARQPGAHRQIAFQLLRAGTSVGANAEEARSSYTRREFAFKNAIVLREARESRFWLRIIADNRLAPVEAIEPRLVESGELVGIFTATVRKAKVERTDQTEKSELRSSK